MSVESRVADAILGIPGNVVLRRELASIARPSSLSRALARLVQAEQLFRIGVGVYAKSRVSSITGRRIPAGSLETLAGDALLKLQIAASPGKAAAAYNAGLTTQIPGRLVAETGRRRISRKLTVGGRSLEYENEYRRPASGPATAPLE